MTCSDLVHTRNQQNNMATRKNIWDGMDALEGKKVGSSHAALNKERVRRGYKPEAKAKHKALSSRLQGVKRYGQDMRKTHEKLTKKGQTALDHSQMRSYEKHLVKTGKMNRRFGQKEH